MPGAVCCICGRTITNNCWCCAACSQEYSLNGFASWPEWARFLKRDEEKRRCQRDHHVQVVPLADLDAGMAGQIEREWYGDTED